MSDIPTIGVGELASPCPLDEALNSWRGFAQAGPATQSKPGAPWLELADAPDAVWRWASAIPARPINPIGCYFLRDLEVSGSGYLFADGRFVREFVHTSDVALQWLGRPDFPDNPLTRPRANRVVIEDKTLLVFGPGSSIFGHWLLDFMPRIVIAQYLLGPALDDFVLLLPDDAPDWVTELVHTFCGWDKARIRRYSRMDDLVVCRRACLPSFAHDGDYALHPLVREFYGRFGNPGAARAKRPICLSRRNQERHTFSAWRIFEARETLERMAVAHGFVIARPEELGFPEQVELFRSANCILGEHGSGMHAAVFADPGTIVATIGTPNAIQLRVDAAFDHRTICLRRLQVIEQVPNRPYRFTVREDDLAGLVRLAADMQSRVAVPAARV
ncbi:MAG: glycosyltransferase 61 family protein [Acetobacteraceae bacterium]